MLTAEQIETITNVNVRHVFLYAFDVKNGNPNGNPDAGGLPHFFGPTRQGFVTDACLKRGARDYMALAREGEPGYEVYFENGAILNNHHDRAYTEVGLNPAEGKKKIKGSGAAAKFKRNVRKVNQFMCRTFVDVRLFGAAMNTGAKAGTTTGPFQLCFAFSVDPIFPLTATLTRSSITKEEHQVTKEGKLKETEMGSKSIVPYGLYTTPGFFSPTYARKTGLSSEDMEIFWEALVNQWAIRNSAARGMMGCRGLYVFSFDNPFGGGHPQDLFDRVSISLSNGTEFPSSFKDYEIEVDEADLPKGVTLTRVVG